MERESYVEGLLQLIPLGSSSPSVERGQIYGSPLSHKRSFKNIKRTRVQNNFISLYFIIQFPLWHIATMNRHLILELLQQWFIEENFALTNNNNDLLVRILQCTAQIAQLRVQVQELQNELHDANRLVDSHVDLNFQMQERIEYLERFIIRLRDFPRPMSMRQARRQLFPDSDSSSTDTE